MTNTTKKNVPDLLGTLKSGSRRRGRPPRVQPSPTSEQIAASMEERAKKMLEVVKILREK